MALVSLGSVEVSEAALAAVDEDLLLALARSIDGRPDPGDAGIVAAFSPSLGHRQTSERGLCGTLAVLALERLLDLTGVGPGLRDQVRRILLRDDPAIEGQTHTSPRFVITFDPVAVLGDRAGPEVMEPGAWPPRPLETLEPGPVPLYVQRLAFWLERAYDRYRSPAFGLRPPRGGQPIPVKTHAVGFPWGWATHQFGIVLDSALGPDLLCSVAVHELFHMFQYEYGVTLAMPWYTSLLEGGAVFAEDALADGVNRYLHEAGPSHLNGPGVLAEPNTSISPGRSEYKSALFWRYVCEQAERERRAPAGRPGRSAFPDATPYRDLIERCFAGMPLDEAMQLLFPGRRLVTVQRPDDPAGDVVTSAETLFGNCALACYLKDLSEIRDGRFTFAERDERLAFAPLLPGEPFQDRVAAVKRRSTRLEPDSAWLAFEDEVNEFAHHFFEIAVDRAVPAVDIVFRAGVSVRCPLLQIAVIGTDGRLRDVHRSDRPALRKRVAAAGAALPVDRVVIVLSSATRGPFALWVGPAPATPDVMATRWNCQPGTEHEADPAEHSWTWTSPDLWVSAGSGRPDLRAGEVNRLTLRLRNRGPRDAPHVRVDFSYREAALHPVDGVHLGAGAWQPVLNEFASPQILRGVTIEPHHAVEGEISWWPDPSLAGRLVCVRGEISAPGDPNTDNKTVLSLLRCLPPSS